MEAVIENEKVVNIIVGHIENSLPLEDIAPTILDTQRIEGFIYDIQATKVIKIYNIVDMPLEELTAKKIADGESYITKTISDMVTTLNAKYKVSYKDIYAVGLYGNSPTYPLATQCKAIWDWNELMWATARANQAIVLAGTMTDAEFLASLPVAPIV